MIAAIITNFNNNQNLYWWTVSPRGDIRPAVSVSALTWFIRYIYY